MAGVKALAKHSGILEGTVALPKNKSLANRALILQAQFPQITISGTAKSTDVIKLQEALTSSAANIHVGAGGTTLRFAMAFWAAQPGAHKVLTGTDTLNNRPISALISALNTLGANIQALGKKGTGPFEIKGAKLRGGKIHLSEVPSSQFITALMLIAPSMEEGLTLSWDQLPSRSYVEMTAAQMAQMGFKVVLEPQGVHVAATHDLDPYQYTIEPDWSAMGFWCEAVALSQSSNLFFPDVRTSSLQGDRKVLDFFEPLGVQASFSETGLELKKKSTLAYGNLAYNLENTPDLAQPLITAMLALKQPFEVNGLQTLPLKECDRIQALVDLAKAMGVEPSATSSTIQVRAYPEHLLPLDDVLASREDHRVAMSLAPLSLLMPITIDAPDVVAKSYPDFWDQWGQFL